MNELVPFYMILVGGAVRFRSVAKTLIGYTYHNELFLEWLIQDEISEGSMYEWTYIVRVELVSQRIGTP